MLLHREAKSLQTPPLPNSSCKQPGKGGGNSACRRETLLRKINLQNKSTFFFLINKHVIYSNTRVRGSNHGHSFTVFLSPTFKVLCVLSFESKYTHYALALLYALRCFKFAKFVMNLC